MVPEEIFLEPVAKTIKGKRIKRNGSPEKPAYLVRSDGGNLALKLVTEIKPRSKIFPLTTAFMTKTSTLTSFLSYNSAI